MTRAPVDTIAAPLFPRGLPWVNVPDGSQVSIIQRDRPLLVEFWDFCRPNSMRTLPYVKAWHERYADEGLRIVGVHSPGLRAFARRAGGARRRRAPRDRLPGADRHASSCCGRTTRTRAGPRATCSTGARGCSSTTTARAPTPRRSWRSRSCSASSASRSPRCAPRTSRARCSRAQTEDREGAYSGPYEAGGVWVVTEGAGTHRREPLTPGARHARARRPGRLPAASSTAATRGGELRIESGRAACGVLATCFTPGVVAG